MEAYDKAKEAARLEAEMAEVCGVINTATGRLVGLIAQVLATGAWEGWGIRSASQWVAWKCGVSPARARRLVSMAGRVADLPATFAALSAGELAEDQVAVVARHIPATVDAEVAGFARCATVAQLRRSLAKYTFTPEPEADAPEEPEEPRRVGFGHDDDGHWRLSAQLPVDEAALVERSLTDARQWLFDHGEADVSWADALVLMAERSLATGATARPHQDRHLVVVHLDTESGAQLHKGPSLPDALRRHLSCDTSVRAVWETRGTPVSVGRSQRIVPDRTRTLIEHRDGGCRVPGCDRSRWTQVHHIEHWEDGGPTDTANLLSLCGFHHRAHHKGQLGIEGDADSAGGLVVSDARGRRLEPCGQPVPPDASTSERLGLPAGNWRHPSGERLHSHWVYFDETG